MREVDVSSSTEPGFITIKLAVTEEDKEWILGIDAPLFAALHVCRGMALNPLELQPLPGRIGL